MSGTSADAIDTALVSFEGAQSPQLIATHSTPIPSDLRADIRALCQPGTGELDRFGHLDGVLGETFADACLALLVNTGIEASAVTAIGSHGQTLRHRPPSPDARAFSLQAGDPNIIAQRTGITTVADFRRKDIAAGGQGAPLVPAFHRAVFGCAHENRALINIGGIANISWLPSEGPTLGFDTGPGNALMDDWIGQHRRERYDRDGLWAAQGKPNSMLLEYLLAHPYFVQPPPKSTGREIFNLQWLDTQLEQMDPMPAPEDVQASLLLLTAHAIASAVTGLADQGPARAYVCGGGAHNSQLMNTLEALLGEQVPVASTEALGIAPDWVEAMAFAWLARQTLKGLAGNLPEVTGAHSAQVLGGIYPA